MPPRPFPVTLGLLPRMDRTAWTRRWRPGTVPRQHHPCARAPPAGQRGIPGPPTRPGGRLARFPVPTGPIVRLLPQSSEVLMAILFGGAVAAESAGDCLGTRALCLRSFPEWTCRYISAGGSYPPGSCLLSASETLVLESPGLWPRHTRHVQGAQPQPRWSEHRLGSETAQKSRASRGSWFPCCAECGRVQVLEQGPLLRPSP